jgi:predicted MPP superfamily phosphohydrolase
LEHYQVAFEKDLKPTQFVQPGLGADVLVLAGDIGNPDEPTYRYFLSWCAKNWSRVVVVAGNHEFYNARGTASKRTIADRLEACRAAAAAAGPNVIFLEKEKLELEPGLSILGCTLWTDIPEDTRYDAIASMNDYRLIYTEPKTPVSFDALKAEHKAATEWLATTLEEIKGSGQAIVVTHHMPTFKAISRKFKGNPLNSCFASNLDGLLERTKPAAWICGHTHSGGEYLVGSTPVVLNPFGYPGESVPSRSTQKFIEVPRL